MDSTRHVRTLVVRGITFDIGKDKDGYLFISSDGYLPEGLKDLIAALESLQTSADLEEQQHQDEMNHLR